MRLLLACVVLMLLPVATVVIYKSYQQFRAQQLAEEQAENDPGRRGEVLFFNASWCGPCRHMKPIVAQLRRQGYHMRDVDVDNNPSLATKYGISGVPTFVFVVNGQEVRRFSGGTSADNLRKMCSAAAYH